MQRLLKFATSPSTNRRGVGQNGTNRQSKSIEVEDDSNVGSPPRELDNRLKVLSFSVPDHSVKSPQERDAAISPQPPPSPHPSAASSGDSSLLSPPAPVSPPFSDTSPPPVANCTLTPTRSRRMAFFNSNRFSLDEYSPNSKFGLRNPTADATPPGTTPTASPHGTPPQHQRRQAVHLPAIPIRLVSPKSGGGGGSGTPNKSVTDFGDLEYMNTSNEGYRLTVEQRELVRQAWRSSSAEKGRSTAGVWIFKRIFAHYPYLKRVFNLHEVEDENLLDADPQFQKHAQVFTNVLEMIIDCIDALDDSLGPLLLSYGSKHVQFESGQGFRPEYWDAFAVAMTEYATNNWKFMKNSHRRAEALRAWRILVFFIVSKVKQGFMLEKKAVEKRRKDSCCDDEKI